MSRMIAGYVNGELVYSMEAPIYGSSNVAIIKHRDLVLLLNRFFRKIENTSSEEITDESDLGLYMFCLLAIFNNRGTWGLPLQIKDKNAFFFNKHQKIREPRLFSGSKGRKTTGDEVLPKEAADLLNHFIMR
jgi:hypothetical protein